jgi:hypothetical protein
MRFSGRTEALYARLNEILRRRLQIAQPPKMINAVLARNIESELKSIARDLGPLTEAESNLLLFEVYGYAGRLMRKQRLIQRDLAVAEANGYWVLYQECRDDLKKLTRRRWDFARIVKAKILVRRKGTERSRSKSGCQALGTHTTTIFDSDRTTRWLASSSSTPKQCPPE